MADHSEHSHHHHHHHHGVQPPVTNGEAFTEANRTHWDNFASSYTAEQWQVDLINKVTELIVTNINWIGVDFIDPASTFESATVTKQARMLDYACGPGTITGALAGRLSEYVGVDLSTNMVQAYNTRFHAQEASGDEQLNAHAYVGNLLDEKGTPDSLSDEKFFNFDLVVVGLGFHHFQNVQLAARRLVERLKPGGVFMIVDFVTHPVAEHEGRNPSSHTVAHHGFSREEVDKCFHDAGLEDVDMLQMGEKVAIRNLHPREIFLARGRKPLSHNL